MSRPPSPHQPRPTHVPLSLRTAIPPTQKASQRQGQSSSPSNLAQPKPISTAKFNKALKLYTHYYLVKGLAQQDQVPHSATETTNNLNIPLPARARSLTSRGSSKPYTPSVSTSAYDGVTDISSVVSFGEESHSSGTPNGNTELVNFNGVVVKQRIRRALTPVSRAKAALIRHLESCPVCRTRRVACDLEHHDIASLEDARRKKARTRQRAQSVQQARSTISNSSQNASGSADSALTGGTMGQTSTLFLGIGQRDELLHTPSSDPTPADPQSPALPDYLSEIPSYGEVPAPGNDLTVPYVNADPYVGYQDGQMIALGVLRGFLYYCTHLGELCQHTFGDAEALQRHFETHFSYTRISPAHRYICSSCQCINNFLNGLCYRCGSEGTIEEWIYGSYISMPTFQRYGPDGQDFLRNDSVPYFLSMGYEMPNMGMDFGLGGGMDNGDFNTGGGMNQGDYFYQNDNSFEDPGSQGGHDTGYTTPRSGGRYHFQGNWSQHRVKTSPVADRYRYATALHTSCHHKIIALALTLLAAFTLLFQVHEWLLTKARMFTPFSILSHPHLPALGFAGFLVSFVTCYTYWSFKKLGGQRVRRAQCVSTFVVEDWAKKRANTSQRSHRCPLHDIQTFSIHYRPTAQNTFVRGGLFS